MDMILLLIYYLLQIYSFILLARVILTWVPNIDRNNQWVQMLFNVTEPVLQPIREMLPQQQGIDFSPMVAFIGIYVLSMIITSVM